MHRSSGSLAVLVALATVAFAGCATEATEEPPRPTASDVPAPDLSASGSPRSGAVAFELVDLVTETAVGGTVGATSPLPDSDSVTAFAEQFSRDSMAERLRELVAAAPAAPGRALYAAVVAIGCDAPTEVTVLATPAAGSLAVTAVPSTDLGVECLAPMTTVAVVSVPADALG